MNNDAPNFSNDSTEKLYQKPANQPSPIVKPSRDFFMLSFTYNNWAAKPDSVKTAGFNWGYSIHLCYDFPIKNSNFSFATGIGVHVATVYLEGQQITLADTSAVGGSQARVIPDTAHFSSYKYVNTFLSAPFELRYFGNKLNRNKGFKAAVGLRIGYLMSAYTNGATNIGGSSVDETFYSTRYTNTWEFSTTLRLGWGNFGLFGTYNLTPVFKSGQGPSLTPFSAGICMTGL